MVELVPVAFELLFADDGVQVVLLAAASQPGVTELRIQGVVAKEQRRLAVEPLSLVDGTGIGVLKVIGDVVEGQSNVPPGTAEVN